MRFDFSTSLLITFRNNEKIYRLFLKFHMQFNLILKLSIKRGLRLLVSKKQWGISEENFSEFWFLGYH